MKRNDVIYVYMKEPCVTVLGPGKRYVLWVQGCNRRCKGCIAGSSHKMEDGTPIKIGALAMEIALSGAEGLTISGGEPFLQAEALAQMIEEIHRLRSMGVIVYTGNQYESLLQDSKAQKLLEKTDLLIDGEYVQELDDGKSLRGSSNQRVIALTDVYQEFVTAYGQEGRVNEVFYHGTEVHEIGIPKNEENN